MRSSGFGIIKHIFFLHFFLNFSTYANYKTYFVLIFLGTLNYQVTALGFVCKILLGTSITLDGDGGFRYTLLFVISEKKSEENLCKSAKSALTEKMPMKKSSLFRVFVNQRHYIFKPATLQSLWTAIQGVHWCIMIDCGTFKTGRV